MLILTVTLLGFGGYLVTGWVVDELAESRAERTPKPKRQPAHRRRRLSRALAVLAAGWRDLAHAHHILTGGQP